MTQATFELLAASMHEYVVAHPEDPDAQLAFLESLKHSLSGPTVLSFVARVAGDAVVGLQREGSPLLPDYLQLLNG